MKQPSVWKAAKACHDFIMILLCFTAVPVLSIMYTDKDSNLISDDFYSTHVVLYG